MNQKKHTIYVSYGIPFYVLKSEMNSNKFDESIAHSFLRHGPPVVSHHSCIYNYCIRIQSIQLGVESKRNKNTHTV